MLLFSAFLTALVLTMVLIPPLMRVAVRLSVVDTPNERKVHTGVIPRIGGIAMVVGACIPVVLWLPHTQEILAFLGALLVLLLFGAWDDSKEISYQLKFLGQFLAVCIVVFVGGVKFEIFPFAGLDPVPVYVSIPFTIVFLVGVTNAVNLSDGLDGLAAGVALLSAGAVALLANLVDGQEVMLISFIVAGTIFGFLRYNTYPARIFMGDTGSQFLGFTVGVLSIVLTQQVNTALNPMLPLFLVGLPIVDTLYVMSRRINEGRSPFAADKTHMHHRLLDMGMAHYEAVSVIYLSQLSFLVTAFLLRYQSDAVVFLAYLGLTGVILGGLFLLRHMPVIGSRQLTRQISRLDRSEKTRVWALGAISCGVSAYLLTGALLLPEVPFDIAISSLILLVILIVRLVWTQYLRFVPLRLLVFPCIAFTVYLAHRDPLVITLLSPAVSTGLLVALVALMLLVIRSTKDQTFQTTPTDLLVMALAGGVGVLYQQELIEATLVPVVLGMVVLFYAAELIMRHMQSTWNCFTLGMLAVLSVLSFGLL
ncbi:MAG TPA: undecaprenyl/decaprenyl-phosphate alpha-N-acetylglucosaminyl 1-phosphate transferase [Thiolapillus brandeum]|uniref:Undecaprenyl/decaprenyl-phosphate alpha-N-acetylglucosaminyl 1-phosphate transferase n=1 Tax=Thiolapillus brandeum TaxID=1076588 RepID=A0A831RY56_9GAMM|nr:undecaprenyl/decaprenyl-phosphate alpha-N-acetylglucosaminyl 1-phosphate transferase [Thiolapillus brandeum]